MRDAGVVPILVMKPPRKVKAVPLLKTLLTLNIHQFTSPIRAARGARS